MRARYASFAASFLLVLAAGAALAYAVHSGSAPPTAASTAMATPTATATPVARAHFDVYRDGLTLTYVREPCAAADTAPRFFVRYYPVSSADLQGERGRMRGHNGAGFGFADRGTRSGGRCETTLAIPSAYAISRILTGSTTAAATPGRRASRSTRPRGAPATTASPRARRECAPPGTSTSTDAR